MAVYLALVITLSVVHWGLHWEWLAGDDRFVISLLLSGGLICAVGLWDDRAGLRPRTKLLGQILACLPFVLWGRSVESIHVFDVHLELGLVGVIFTIFWLVACSNVINLVDGLDGLAGTIGVICFVAVAVLSNMQGFNGPLALGLVGAGCLCGFLLHNWPPASIYLGDSGSLMIGFMIGALAIESSMKKATGFALAIPLVLVSVPVFDTCMAIVRRKLNGRGIGEADRGHIHHCLQDRGLSRAQSLLVISALCVVMAAVTVVSAYFQNDRLALGLCLALLALLIVGRVFGYDETVLFFRYIQAMSTLLAATSGVLRTQMAVDRMARGTRGGTLAHWNELTERVAALGGLELEFVCRCRGRRNGTPELVRRDFRGPARGRLAIPLHRPRSRGGRGNASVARPDERALARRAAGRRLSSVRHILPLVDDRRGVCRRPGQSGEGRRTGGRILRRNFAVPRCRGPRSGRRGGKSPSSGPPLQARAA